MERREIDEKYIVYCLAGYEKILGDIRDRIKWLHTSIATTDDVLESIQFSKWHGDLDTVMKLYRRSEEQYSIFLKCYIQRLICEEEKVKRIWYCYQRLPYLQLYVLDALYVKKKSWKVVEAESNMSRSTISRQRNQGIKNITESYKNAID